MWGGCFRVFGKWGVCEALLISSGKLKDMNIHLTTGVHELPQKPGQGGKLNGARLVHLRWILYALGHGGKACLFGGQPGQ